MENDPHELVNLYATGGYEEVERDLLRSLVEWSMETASVKPPFQLPDPPWIR